MKKADSEDKQGTVLEKSTRIGGNSTIQTEGKESFPGYPPYPASEDIYNQDTKEQNLDPENPAETKKENDTEEEKNENNFDDYITGEDLDVPGSELDDQQENIGSEDEENNYYSIGGDNHDALEEDNG